jgi:WD40 repeat protein
VFSPGSDRFASSCVTSSLVREVKVHDFSGREVRLVRELKPGGTCLALSRDGKRLAVADQMRGVVVWDVDAGKELHVLPRGRGLTAAAAFSPDGKLLATATSLPGALKGKERQPVPAEIKVYDVADGRALLTLKADGARPTALAFSPDGKLLASATSDRGIQFWNPSAREGEALVRALPEDGGMIHNLAFSPDGARLYAGGFDGLVRIYEVSSGRGLRGLQAGVRQVTALALSADGTRLAVGGTDSTVRVWPAAPRPASRTLKGHAGPVQTVAFSPDGKRLASAGADRTVRLWDAAGGQELHALKGFARAVAQAVFSPDGKRLATVGLPAPEGEREVEVKIWDAETGAAVCAIAGVSGEGVSVAFDAAGKRLGVLGPGKGLKVYDPETGKEAGGFDVLGGRLRPEKADVVAVSPDGKRLAYANRTEASMIVTKAGGPQAMKLLGQPMPVTGLAWSPNGERLALASGGRMVTVWNADPPGRLGTIQSNRLDLRRAALSADGQRLAIGQGVQVALWELAPPKSIFQLRGHAASVTSVAFSPDGSRLAAGGADGTVVVWDATPAAAPQAAGARIPGKP